MSVLYCFARNLPTISLSWFCVSQDWQLPTWSKARLRRHRRRRCSSIDIVINRVSGPRMNHLRVSPDASCSQWCKTYRPGFTSLFRAIFQLTCCQKCCQIHYGYAQKLEYICFVRPHLRFVHPLNKGTQLSSIKAEILCIIEFDFTCGYKGFSK